MAAVKNLSFVKPKKRARGARQWKRCGEVAEGKNPQELHYEKGGEKKRFAGKVLGKTLGKAGQSRGITERCQRYRILEGD